MVIQKSLADQVAMTLIEADYICVNPSPQGLRRDRSCVHFTPENFGAAVGFSLRSLCSFAANPFCTRYETAFS